MLLDQEQATNKQEEIVLSPQIKSSRLRDRRVPVNYQNWDSKSHRRRKSWNEEHDSTLAQLVLEKGTREWSYIAKEMQKHHPESDFAPKQYRERWFNHLDPSLNKGDWTPIEELRLLLYSLLYGKRWSSIAKRLSGRTDHNVKNHFKSLSRRARGLFPRQSDWPRLMLDYMESQDPSLVEESRAIREEFQRPGTKKIKSPSVSSERTLSNVCSTADSPARENRDEEIFEATLTAPSDQEVDREQSHQHAIIDVACSLSTTPVWEEDNQINEWFSGPLSDFPSNEFHFLNFDLDFVTDGLDLYEDIEWCS